MYMEKGKSLIYIILGVRCYMDEGSV